MKKNRLSLLGIFAALIAVDVSAKEEKYYQVNITNDIHK